ncbi:MAG: S-methyl-5-thioribose-1-phosphate isomerase [Cyanobacteria bacterium]|nr:S-methyl-5-thioribose-1-phosphate isomerase [Cyanobacteriota bacterium]
MDAHDRLHVLLLDQRQLPGAVVYTRIETAEQMAEAITQMIVRGAPAIGIAGAYGFVLALHEAVQSNPDATSLLASMSLIATRLKASRPTAVNLAWAVNRLMQVLQEQLAECNPLVLKAVLEAVQKEALAIHEEDYQGNQQMGRFGAALLPKGAKILTHCNAGALATGGYGTALGVVRAAYEADPTIRVYADETRPRLQGARLTAWELMQDGIPVTLIADSMAAVVMRDIGIDAVFVGADRIAANGDTANKIGTYQLAISAAAHQVPFYIVAPLSTIDLSLAEGRLIPIEERDPDEVRCVVSGDDNDMTVWLAPQAVPVFNPSFDVTPARYITGVITEKGIAYPPYAESLLALFQ